MNLVATPEISAESAKDNVVNDELPDSVEKFEFNTTQPDPEAVANLAPDMLLTVAAWFDYYDSEMQDKLEAIAPVLRISGVPDENTDWLQPLVEQAELIGKKAETEQSIADYNSTIDRLAQTVNGAGQTVAAGKAPALSYYHRSGLTIAGANFAEYVAEQRTDDGREDAVMHGRDIGTVVPGFRQQLQADLLGTDAPVVRHLAVGEVEQQLPQRRRDGHRMDRRPGHHSGRCGAHRP